jgi:uracil-DNA glycosylase family protein
MSPDPTAYRNAVAAGEATLEDAAAAAKGCQACRLWKRGTQTVFGAGPLATARVVFIGEQPGDREDLAGQPFVGPAGRVLDDALDEAGIDRKTAYLTNVVKHFSWEQRGKRRIHKKPKSDEIRACRPWLEAELAALQPELVVCLGATAAQAVLGSTFRVTQGRGVIVESTLAPRVLATVHPSSILRAPDSETRALEFKRFVADLQVAAQALTTPRQKAIPRPRVAPGRPARSRRPVSG